MDHPEEAAESVNSREQGLSAFEPSKSNVPNEPTKTLLRILQDMARVLDRLTSPKAPIDTIRRDGAEEFHGSSMEESEKAEFWLEKLERVSEEVRCPPDQRASCAVSLLQGEEYDWWKLVLKSPMIPNPLTWEFFVQEFRAKYVTEMYRDSKWKQFLNLKQRNLSVAEYEKDFSHLSKYAPELVLNEAFWCRKFEDGMHDSIKRYLAPMNSLQTMDFYQLVQAAMKVERLETSRKERSQKKKFSRGAPSSWGKRARESPAQSEYSFATRGRRRRSNVARSTGRGASVGHGEIPECPHCHKRHLGVCRLVTGGCFRCGSLEHLIAQCPQESGDNRSQQGSGRGRSTAPLSTRD